MAWKKMLYLAFIALILPNFIATDEGTEENFAIELTADNFDEAIAKTNHFVKFFAPWSGHCRKLRPVWEQLAKMMNAKDKPQVIIARVDCTRQEELCAKHRITGFPTLRFFKMGERQSVKFKGSSVLPALTEFINELLNFDIKTFTAARVKGMPVQLDQYKFTKYLSTGNFFVNFYIPWNSDCQSFAPVWQQLANTLQNVSDVSIVQIAFDVDETIFHDWEIKTYPTLLWIENGKKIEEYTDSRSHDDLHRYVKKMLRSNGNADKLKVLELTGDNFEKLIARGVTFVKFYDPLSIPCRKLEPVWDQLAEKIHGSDKVIKIAQVDCTSIENTKLCADQQIDGYPTLIAYKNGERQSEYGSSLPELVSYIRKFVTRDEL